MDLLPILVPCVLPLLLHALWTRGTGTQWARAAQVGLGLSFLVFALGHVVMTDEMVAMLPPWIPLRAALVYATGLLELGVALALFSARWRDRASIWAAALLIGFFPVNLYAAWQRVGGDLEREMGLDYLWVRAPLQLFLIGWALWPVLRPSQRKP